MKTLKEFLIEIQSNDNSPYHRIEVTISGLNYGKSKSRKKYESKMQNL